MVINLQAVYENGTIPAADVVPLEASPAPLSWPQGEDGSIIVSVVDPAGNAIDLTGFTAKLGVRLFPFDAAPLIVKSGTIATPANGQISFALAGADTAALSPDGYRWDAWITQTAGGARHQVVPASSFELLEADLLPTE